jgi:CHAT domain-containing protein
MAMQRSKPGISSKILFFCAFFLGLLVASSVIHASVNDPRVLQEQAIARIDHYLDNFRRTFDQHSLRHELIQAADELEESIELFRRDNARQDTAHSLVKLGDVRRYLNEWDSAIHTYEEAARAARAASAPGVECKALLGNARTHLYGNKTSGPALELVRLAVPLAQQANEPSYIFDAWDLLAQVQIAEGDLVGAADSMNRAFAVKEAIIDDKQLFYGYLDRADVYQRFAEKCDYERDFKSCLDAVERSRRDYKSAYAAAHRLGWDGLAQQAQGFIGRLEMRKQLILAQQRMHTLMVESGIFLPVEASDVVVSEQFTAGENPHLSGLFAWIESYGGMPPLTDARGAYIKGLLNESAGNADEAMEWYLRAVELLDEDRGFLYDERARGTYVEDKVEFYYTAMLNLLDRKRYQEAFRLMERSRSRVMSDLIATKSLVLPSPKELSLYADMLGLRGEIAQLQACLFVVRSGKPVDVNCQALHQRMVNKGSADRGITVKDEPGAKPAINVTALEATLEQRQKQYNTIRDRMTRDTPKLARLVTSDPVTLNTLQKTLRRDRTEMIAYLSLESQVLIWHIGPDTMHVRSVFLPRSVLKDKVERLRKSLIDPKHPYDDKTAHELYLYLITPVLQWIKSDHLVIVPHEDLHYLPFQALQTKRGIRYLGEDYQLSYAPSATVLVSLDPAETLARPRLLALADPALQHAPEEVRAIGTRFSGRVVADTLPMEADVKAWLPQNELVHLAVHGTFTADEPLMSHLHLGAGKGDDGKLTAAEMYGLPLGSARLVVLSACETGSVRATHANEVIGMMRGLIFAGADSLLLSAWKIDDKATAEWMQAFYTSAETRPPADAARDAIRNMRGKSSYQHPYYWSPFLLISR